MDRAREADRDQHQLGAHDELGLGQRNAVLVDARAFNSSYAAHIADNLDRAGAEFALRALGLAR